MKAKFHSKYNTVDKNGKGIVMFRYLVSGTQEELKQYKAAQGEFYRENDEKVPMFFSPNFTGNNISLGITSKGKVYADTSSLDKVNSLVSRYPGVLGEQIAKLGAQQLLGDLLGNAGTVSAPASVEAVKLDA